MSALDDPNFGTRRPEESNPARESGLKKSDFGGKGSNGDQYTQTRETAYNKRNEREQEKLEKKFRREAKYGRVSQDTKSAIASAAINDFVDKIIAEKTTAVKSSNTASTAQQSESVPTITTTSPVNSTILDIPEQPPKPQNSPRKMPFEIFDVCVNGEPAKFSIPAIKIETP